MKCPKCNTSWVTVLQTRHTTEEAISRQRKCATCGYVFATAEVIVPKQSVKWVKQKHLKKAQFAVKPELLAHLVSESHFMDSERSLK